jgi:hypothetical protein
MKRIDKDKLDGLVTRIPDYVVDAILRGVTADIGPFEPLPKLRLVYGEGTPSLWWAFEPRGQGPALKLVG